MAVSVSPNAAGRLPPQDTEAETALLGSILMADTALDSVLIDVRLRPEDFYRDRHRAIFRAMIRLKERPDPEPVDQVTVSADLKRAGELEEAGGEDYVYSLPEVVPAPGRARNYARIVKDAALMRGLLATTREIQDRVYEFDGDARELLEESEGRLYRVAHDQTGEVRTIEQVLNEELDRLEAVSRRGVAITGTPSGFKDLDELTGGFQPGNLIVLAARPSMGKSALVANIAENAAVDHGRSVALFSLEMSETELAQRFVASRAKLSGDDLRKGRVREDRWPKVVNATQKLASAPVFIDDSSDIGILELRAKARRLHSRHTLDLLIVDYLQLMRPEDPRLNRVEQVGQLSRGLKILSKELGIPVIAVAQLSRAVEGRSPPRPMLSDLRESGQIEADADVVIFIYRDEHYNQKTTERPGEADLIIAKHRNGPVGEVVLTFLSRYPKFANHVGERTVEMPTGSNGSG